TVADGGTVNVNGFFGIGLGSTLNLGTGTLAGTFNAPAIVNDGQIVAKFTDTSTLSAAVSGIGTLSKPGARTLILSGTNAFAAGTGIMNGTLQIGNGGFTGSIAGDIPNNAALVFNRAGALTYAGVIDGTGTVTQAGSGILTLSGANLYTGATAVNA